MIIDHSKKAEEKPDHFQLSGPDNNLPNGGSAILGIGEEFAANPVAGTSSMGVPIATSPGRAGFGPQLGRSYNPGADYESFGFGWSLSMRSISRKTDKSLPHYQDAEESDVIMLSGVEDLVPVLKQYPLGWEAKFLDLPCLKIILLAFNDVFLPS